MGNWTNRVIKDVEMSDVYKDFSNQWLLFEVLSTNRENRPVSFNLLLGSYEKDDLHEYIMENEIGNKETRLIILYADPDKPCEIG